MIMKTQPFIYTVVSAASLLCVASGAYAANSSVEAELKSRPEVSKFYEGLVNTGVINELHSGSGYTIFAPTNEAMDELTQEKYPCFYSEQCRDEVADILRNHIVASEVSFATPRAPGAYSIDGMFLSLSEPRKGDYMVSGANVLSQNQKFGGNFYEIDDVIASPQELADVKTLKYIPVASVEKTVTTDEIYYEPNTGGESVTRTTTTVTTTPPVLVPVR